MIVLAGCQLHELSMEAVAEAATGLREGGNLSERLARIEYVGMAAILLAVFLVTSAKLKSGRPAAEVDLAAVEQ